MPLVTTSVPNLAGGVSQQPASQRLPNQCEAQENALPLLVGGLVKRPPLNHVAELKTYAGASVDLSSVFTHFVTRDADEEFIVSLTGVGNTVLVNDTAGDAKEVEVDLGSSTYLTSSTPQSSFRAITIADVTFLVNTSIPVQMKTGDDDLSPYSRAQSSAPHEGLVWIKVSQQGIKLRLNVKVEGGGTEWAKVEHTPAADEIGTDVYAYPPNAPSTTQLAAALSDGTNVTDCADTASTGTTGLEGLTNYTASTSGSVIFVQNTSVDFNITTHDSLGQTAMKVIKDEVADFAELPPNAPDGMILLVKGEPESEVDDYYVKFETNGPDEDFGSGLWLETIGPGIAYQWDYDTLPHILIRQSDGTFMVKRADGTTPGAAPDGSDYSGFKFTPRETGSDLTNPQPSFVGRVITDISFFKNRLAIMSGEDCVLSEAAEFFNFFRTTTTQLLDTAPIDVGVGGTEVNKIEKATPFADRLVLFSTRTQFVLQGEAILSPMTASITQATNYDVTTSVSPVLAGNALFFAFSRGSFSGVREFYKSSETDIKFEAVETTSHAPKYIPGTIQKLSVSTHEDILAVLSRTPTVGGSGFDATTDLYMYKYFSTDRGRVQAAWFKFTFSNCEVLDMHFVTQSLYVVLKRGTKTFIERMDLQTGLVDTGSTYVTTIDRRTKITGQSGFTLTLPYDVVGGDTMQVVSSDGEVMTIKTTGTNTIELYEEFTASDVFYVGIPYTMRYQMTEPVLKRPKQDGGWEMIATGRHQLRYMTVVYDGTSYFNIRVTPEIGGAAGTATDYPFSGRFLSAGGFLGSAPSETGDFRFPVFAQSDAVKIEIFNDSPLPSNIQSVEFEANYVSRSQPRFGG